MKKVEITPEEAAQLAIWGFNPTEDGLTYEAHFFDSYKTHLEKMNLGAGRIEWRYYIYNNNQQKWSYHSNYAWALKAAYKEVVIVHIKNSLEGF